MCYIVATTLICLAASKLGDIEKYDGAKDLTSVIWHPSWCSRDVADVLATMPALTSATFMGDCCPCTTSVATLDVHPTRCVCPDPHHASSSAAPPHWGLIAGVGGSFGMGLTVGCVALLALLFARREIRLRRGVVGLQYNAFRDDQVDRDDGGDGREAVASTSAAGYARLGTRVGDEADPPRGGDQ